MPELLLKPGTMTTSVGWGRFSRTERSDRLRTAQWEIAPSPAAEAFAGYDDADYESCREDVPWEAQAHKGSSGGPRLSNLKTHGIESLHETCRPELAPALAERLEIHYTPKHGSWFNIAEIALSTLRGQSPEPGCRFGNGGMHLRERRTLPSR